MQEIVTLNIYTSGNILTFDVMATAPNFGEVIANGIENDSLLLMQADGSPLILFGLNIVAVEIKNTPHKNNCGCFFQNRPTEPFRTPRGRIGGGVKIRGDKNGGQSCQKKNR